MLEKILMTVLFCLPFVALTGIVVWSAIYSYKEWKDVDKDVLVFDIGIIIVNILVIINIICASMISL